MNVAQLGAEAQVGQMGFGHAMSLVVNYCKKASENGYVVMSLVEHGDKAAVQGAIVPVVETAHVAVFVAVFVA